MALSTAEGGDSHAGGRPWAWALHPASFVAAMALLQLLHALLRPLLTDTIGNDNADQLFFAQSLQAGYAYEQPPLYTWLVWVSQQLFGPSVMAVAAVRYALVFLIHLFAYLAGRRLLRDARLQLACGLSPMLLYPLVWRLHEADTQGVLSSVLVLAATWSLLRIVQERRLADHLAFGLILGLGVLASGYFGIAAATLLLAALCQASSRRALFRWPLLPALALALLVCLPTLLWALDQGPAFLQQVRTVLADWKDTLNPWYLRAWYGFVNLFVGSFPAWLILPLFFLAALRPLPRGSLGEGGRLLLLYGSLLLIVSPLAAVVFEIHKAHQFRLYPLTLPLLPLFFRRLELRGAGATGLRWLFILYAILVLVIVQARFQHIEAGPAFCARCRMQTPYPALAERLKAEGYAGGGTVVAGDIHIAGNFRTRLPEARILTPRYPEVRPPPPARPGPCLIVWNAEDDTAGLRAFLDGLGVAASLDQGRRVDLAIPLPPRIAVPQRHVTLMTLLLPQGQGDCR